MKRTLYFALAVLMAFASCQKEEAEQPRASLSLLMETFSSDTKLHIENVSLPVWDGGDALWINGSSCSVTLDGGRAKVHPAVSSAYKTVYPYSIVGTESGNKVGVTLPYEQTYAVNAGGHQLITAPLCGVVTSGTEGTLYNLGALVRVDLTNTLGEEVVLQRIRLQSQKCKLSGAFEVDDLSSSSPVMAPVSAKAYSDQDSWVSLAFGNSGLAQGSTAQKSYYLAIPPCSTSGKFAIEVYYTRGGDKYRQTIVTDDATTIDRNKLAYVDMSLTTARETLIPEDPYNVNATLKTVANNAARSGSSQDGKIKQVVFLFNSGSTFDVTKNYVYLGGTRCYAEWDNSNSQGLMTIHVPAASLTNVDFSGMFAYMTALEDVCFNANGECSGISAASSTAGMFAGCSSLGGSLHGAVDLRNINFEAVTNTSYMFRGCSSLGNIDWVGNLGSSPATVTDMRLMFANCISLTSISLPDFHTTASTDMQMMFGLCDALTSVSLGSSFVVATGDKKIDMLNGVHDCHFHCTETQWTALSSGTGMGSGCERESNK